MPKKPGRKEPEKRKEKKSATHFGIPLDIKKGSELRIRKDFFRVPEKAVAKSFEKGFYENLRHLILVDLRNSKQGIGLVEDLVKPKCRFDFEARKYRIKDYADSRSPGEPLSKMDMAIIGALDLNPYSLQTLADFDHARSTLEKLSVSGRGLRKAADFRDLKRLFGFVRDWNELLPLDEKGLSYRRKRFLKERAQREKVLKKALGDLGRKRMHGSDADIAAYEVLEEFANHTVFKMFLGRRAEAKKKFLDILTSLAEAESRELIGEKVH